MQDEQRVQKQLRERISELKALRKANTRLGTVKDSKAWIILKEWIQAKAKDTAKYVDAVAWREFINTEIAIKDKIDAERGKGEISALAELVALVERGTEGIDANIVARIKKLKEGLKHV